MVTSRSHIEDYLVGAAGEHGSDNRHVGKMRATRDRMVSNEHIALLQLTEPALVLEAHGELHGPQMDWHVRCVRHESTVSVRPICSATDINR